jgi:hypothetical protein
LGFHDLRLVVSNFLDVKHAAETTLLAPMKELVVVGGKRGLDCKRVVYDSELFLFELKRALLRDESQKGKPTLYFFGVRVLLAQWERFAPICARRNVRIAHNATIQAQVLHEDPNQVVFFD